MSLLAALTLQQVWDGRYPGDASSPRFWERPVILARVVVNIKGWRMHPHRMATDGKVFRLDAFLGDGRTLRAFLPADFPCEDLPVSAQYPPPPQGLAEALGFGQRDRSRPVTDADRLLLDLTAPAHLTATT